MSRFYQLRGIKYEIRRSEFDLLLKSAGIRAKGDSKREMTCFVFKTTSEKHPDEKKIRKKFKKWKNGKIYYNEINEKRYKNSIDLWPVSFYTQFFYLK